jgi:protein-L-isoaspartate(D-aspartate) O-methyltransferase
LKKHNYFFNLAHNICIFVKIQKEQSKKMVDSYKHQGLRKILIENLKSKYNFEDRVLDALNQIPRHLFLDTALLNYAYSDKAFKIGAGQTISQPSTVAFQTQLLELKKGEKVLEIGTGSGYQTSVLSVLGAKVFTIERQRELYDSAKLLLQKLNFSAKFFYGDGYKGLPAFAPFDKIIVTAGAPYIPEDLLSQLKIGGKMIIPVGEGEEQIMLSIHKLEENKFVKKEHGRFAFVPLLQNKN